MSLIPKQARFAQKVALLIIEINRRQLLAVWGEAWRSPETCALYAKDGRGIKNSLHPNRLAVDLILFGPGNVELTPAEYEPIGVWWESQSEPDLALCWGGRFHTRPDVYHFSAPHNGVE